MPIPDSLAEKYRVFRTHGRVFRENEELFNDTSWFAVMIGQLMKPRTYDPVADVLSLENTQARLDEIRSAVKASAEVMPMHRKFIEDNCAA
jgi:tryptophan halogenase